MKTSRQQRAEIEATLATAEARNHATEAELEAGERELADEIARTKEPHESRLAAIRATSEHPYNVAGGPAVPSGLPPELQRVRGLY